MLPSTMPNLFRWALTPQCLEIILETVVISFLSVFYSSNHGLRETLRKIQYENHPVSATSRDFPTFLPFVQLFRDWKQVPSNQICIVHHIAQKSLSRIKISPFIFRNSNICRYSHETPFTATPSQLSTFLFTLVHERMGMQRNIL
jgi:hypothetical protein